MKLSCKVIAILLILLNQAAIAQVVSQVSTGMPPYGSFGGGPFDVVNLGNLNVHFSIPVLHKAGRGTPFTYDLSYDSSIWTPVTSSGVTQWQPATNWGWRGITEAQTGYLSYQTSTSKDNFGCVTTYYSYTYHDAYGALHSFPGAAEAQTYFLHGSCIGFKFYPLTSTAKDGSGYYLSVAAPDQLEGQLTDRGGRVIVAPFNGTSGAASYTDDNGNQLSVSSTGVFTDTLRTTALTVSGSGTPSSPTTFTYTAPSGGNAVYKMNYSAYTVATGFGASGIKEYGPITNVPLVSSITLPDQTNYQFTYESGPSSCSPCVTGRIHTITLPTGGTITYSYSGGSNGIESDGSTAGLSRQLTGISSPGTWSYTRTKLSGTPGPGSTWQTLVTDANGNNTYINFAEDSTTTNLNANPPTRATYNLYETQRQVKQLVNGSQNLLLTTERCYNGNYTNCGTATVSSPIDTIDSYSQPVNGAARGSHVEYNGSFNGSGLVSRDQEYGYGVTMGASLTSSNALRDIRISYSRLGNNIYDKPSSVQVWDCSTGTCSEVASTTYNYDETMPTSTTGTPQHITISGSRGNLTTVKMSTSSSASLTKTFSYYDTGNVYQTNDANGAQTSYTYSACGNSFPTTISEPLSLSRSIQSNCTGGVITQVTDENGNAFGVYYTGASFGQSADPNFWRPYASTDRMGNATAFSYPSNTVSESTMAFNGNNSVIDVRSTRDGFGRPIIGQVEQGYNGQNYDSVETDYDVIGRLSRQTMPYVATASSPCTGTCTGANPTYDVLGRPQSIKDGRGGQISYSYNQNDVLQTISGGSGSQTFQKQMEYDALGRLTSVCEVTSGTTAWPAGSCAQTNPLTGYWTTYTYDFDTATGHTRTTVKQNAQGSATQTRTYEYDLLGRLVSEVNPETGQNSPGTVNYTYDTACGSYPASAGNMTKRVDNAGNTTCYQYDSLHRLTWVNYPIGPNAANSRAKFFVYDSPFVNNTSSTANLASRLSAAGTCTTPTCSVTTNSMTHSEFAYDADGRITDVWEQTPSFSAVNHVTRTYWPNGLVHSMSGVPGLPTIYYGASDGSGLDGEGRVTKVTAASGSNPIACSTAPCVSYNTAGQVTNLVFGSGDSDSYAYDPNTGRMTQYQFNVNGQSLIGKPGWNANGTLGSLNITDPFNSGDNQNCTYSYDDLARLAGVSCGSAWAQTFTYDPFGNITKSGSLSWQPGYYSATNHYQLAGTSYDSNGNVLSDTFHNYQYDVDGNITAVDVGGSNYTDYLTYNAFGSMVEYKQTYANNNPTWLAQQVYGDAAQSHKPLGRNILSGGTVYELPLPAGAAMVAWSGAPVYGHADWLGSIRLNSTTGRTVNSDVAFAPFGEVYNSPTTFWYEFAGLNNNLTDNVWDADARRYHAKQGRWLSPDPAGLGVVDPTNPQTWNRYAYVANNPLSFVDPLGLQLGYTCPGDQTGEDGTSCAGGGGGGGGGSADCSAEFSDCSGSYMDGIQMPASTVQTLLSLGWAVPCPNGQCSGVAIGGVLSYFSAYLTGSTYAPYAGAGSIFDTNNQAMVAGAMYAENQSLLNNGNEQCGVTTSVGDQFTYSAPAEGSAHGCDPAWAMTSAFEKIDGAYHSHGVPLAGYNSEAFSVGLDPNSDNKDTGWSNFWGVPLSLATPGGNVMIYFPQPGQNMGCQTFFLGSPYGTGTNIPIC
jgi:RHS repeat-associated protein